MTEPTCKSCGKAFSEHLGVQPLCEKYQNTARELRMAYEESGQIEIEMERLQAENAEKREKIAFLTREVQRRDSELAAAKRRESQLQYSWDMVKDYVECMATPPKGPASQQALGQIANAESILIYMQTEEEEWKQRK